MHLRNSIGVHLYSLRESRALKLRATQCTELEDEQHSCSTNKLSPVFKALLRTERCECTCYVIFSIVLTCCTALGCVQVQLCDSFRSKLDDPKENNEKIDLLRRD